MILLGNTQYKLCLIDTCIISEFLKNKKTVGNKIITKFLDEKYLFAYTIQTIGEIRKCPDIYDEFFRYLSIIPSFLLKNYNQLLDEEIEAYPKINKKDPVLIHFKMLQKNNYYEEMKGIFESPVIKSFFENEEKDEQDTLDSLLSYVDKYPSKGKQYTKKEIEEWVELVTMKKIIESKINFINEYHVRRKEIINFNNFSSWKSIGYTTFYKFYFKHRKPKLSDLNDILMSCVYPYIDATLMEKNNTDILRQIQEKHSFLTHLKLFFLKDFK